MNQELQLRFFAELFAHLTDEEKEEVISLIISILSRR